MSEQVRVRVRPAEGDAHDETGKPRARPRVFVDALRVASSVLPSRDPAKNGREKLALYLGLGLPIALAFVVHAIVSDPALFVPFVARQLWVWRVLVFLSVTGGTLAVVPLVTFGLALGFARVHRSGGRVQQALVCPYCRDEVDQEGTVVCARSGCGALYHRECWDECSVQYGGCAIYGCSSKKSREVSAAGYVLRLSRLVLAAALFPPRLARALRDRGGEELAPILRRSLEEAKLWHQAAYSDPRQTAVVLSLGIVVAFGNLLWQRDTIREEDAWASFFVIPLGLMALPFVAAILISPVYFTVQAIATVFRNELAALGRADEGGGSVIGRLAAGSGKK